MLLLLSLIITLGISYAEEIGIDVYYPVHLAQFQCMKELGYSLAIVRGYISDGAIDKNAKETLQDAALAGLKHDAYHFPCVGGVSPADQVNKIVDYLGNLPQIYWVIVGTNTNLGCGWQDMNTNCGFLHNLVSDFQGRGVQVGIASSYYMWNTIFGGPNNCNQFSNLQLWYADYDGQQNFSDFQSFGGWKSPNIKQYNLNGSLWEIPVNFDWYPWIGIINASIWIQFIIFPTLRFRGGVAKTS